MLDTDSCEMKPERLLGSKMVVRQDENNTGSDSENEIDIEGSTHDSFIQIINDYNNNGVPAEVNLGGFEPLDIISSTANAKSYTILVPQIIRALFLSSLVRLL